MTAQNTASARIDRLFSMPAARADRWRHFSTAAENWAAGHGEAMAVQQSLAALAPYEEYHAFPGMSAVQALEARIGRGDASGTAQAARHMATALLNKSYRSTPGEWDTPEDSTPVAELLPVGREHTARPYFEVLVVVNAPPAQWPGLGPEIRRLRRREDAFVYEPIFVGSYEDALCAAMLNPVIAAVVVYEGFALRSRHDPMVLRQVMGDGLESTEVGVTALRLCQKLKSARPDLDLYLCSDRDVERMAGDPSANVVRRIFYAVEEPMELHLAILEGVQERYQTPFFDNLKKYAQRPIGTFHALPIARGKSVFKSDWIRDMGEFYGMNLFLAESSATTGGLDSLLEPTGNIKKAQELAARAFGADHVFFVTNGTSTSNKMVHQALCAPGDIVILDRNCHKSHH